METEPLARERRLTVAALAGISLVAWGYLFWDSRTLDCMRWMASGRLWNLPGFLAMLAMWSIMMVAMMVPSATPMVMTFAAVNGRRKERGEAFVPTAMFVLGYVIVWTAFSVLATTAQFWLQSVNLLSMSMVSTSSVFTGCLLIAAGLFQWTAWKQRCLKLCSSPLHFLMTGWKDGSAGALSMGIRHGLGCLGCCWAVMALLFTAGVMNLVWIAALSIFVLAEKLAPRYLSRAGGAAMAGAGVWMLVA